MTLFDSLQSPDGRRDVTEMLKQLVTPADQIEEGMEQFVLFTLNEQTYAAPITNVFELSLPPDLIQVPNTPAWILGVSNMRGEIISVIDFKEFLNIEPDGARKFSRMIIAQTLDKQLVIGLMVDGISGIKYFSADAIQPLEQHEPGVPDAFFRGACLFESEVVIFLDLEFILQSSKMRQFQ
jgi:purine-binding chemotaxis protein CheW